MRIVDIAAGHGRYVLEALDNAERPARFDFITRLQRHKRRRPGVN